MKYGETLRQRSIPKWGPHNVDYDDLKLLIKEHTTPGNGKAVSIPGQVDEGAQAFGDELFALLLEQHDRINLFIKSKTGEIERRLEHINKRIQELQSRQPVSRDTRLPAKLVERYAKFDDDVSKAGEEVRSLSRFRAAQRTAFTKLLKKYKKWTGSSELGLRFKSEVTDKPDSFCQLDLGYLLDLYTDVLHAVRAPFEVSAQAESHVLTSNTLNALSASASPAGSVSSSTASQIVNSIEESTEVGYDTTLATIPIGAKGGKATFWIHPDHIVEVQVFLLQYMRLYNSGKAKSTHHSSSSATPLRRNSSFDYAGNFGREDDIGLIVIDNPEDFAKKQNASPIGDSEEVTGRCLIKAAGNARWTSSGEAVVMVGLDSKQGAANSKVAKLKRKYVDAILDTSTPYTSRRPSYSSTSSGIDGQNVDAAAKAVDSVREWLNNHKDVAPLAEVASKRTRFVGLGNNTSGGLWATLDRDISMKKYTPGELSDHDWSQKARSGSYNFPHAVLEVRREGTQSADMIKALDRIHLTERVRGFSLEVHAVWMCSKPDGMSPPLWIPTLETDIRKLPEPVKKHSRQAATVAFSAFPPTSQSTSRSTTSATDGQTSPSTIHMMESSATSGPEYLETPTLSSFKTKRKSYGTIIPEEPSNQDDNRQSYWNEYDHPEDGSEDEAYFIYIDPNSSTKFPGQDTVLKWAHKTKRLFRLGKPSEETTLLHSQSPSVYPTSDGDDSDTSDEAVRAARRSRRVGNMSPDSAQRQGYFSSLFSSLHGHETQPVQPTRHQSEQQVHSLIELIEMRQHEREMTKLRLYAICLVASVVIDIILGTLVVTGRRKERGVIDAGILFGTIANLLLLIVAVGSMRTRREKLGWFHQTIVSTVVVAVVVVDVLLMRWVLA